ncbi:alanine racemase [Methylococcus sp. EFPC2]|uniref:alanine racemase n=1 Tax=Methylococcus sp. EFPC2 TaxID=2812648 RepID=UPI001967AB7F|nr:alanine racemase [Methylococcus sp. EFPC2]QSA98001.1 alanine racemase [Methylococcus sp. EFPC2]
MLPAAHAVLDMTAIVHNLARVRECAPNAKVMAVVKANAYGHGLVRVARALADADAFAVARVDEGVSLRMAGVSQRVAVLQGYTCAEELELYARYSLEPVIHSILQVDLLETTVLDRTIAVWLKLDTGMHRLGLNPEQFEACYRRLQNCAAVRQPLAMMTHLANADERTDPLTGQQLDLFGDTLEGLTGERSVANSAGLLAWERAHAEWVRPGLVLYGASPFPDRSGPDEGLKPVMTLRTRLIAIRNLPAGEAIGYGGDWVCPHSTRVGVAAIGYGDGYPRQAPSGTPVLVRGRRAPLIGRVSMDMVTLDLSELPEARVGDEVTLWGEGLPVEEIARHAGTIPYVLLCNVMPRVKLVEL